MQERVLTINSQIHRNSSLLSLSSWIIYLEPWFRGDICSHRPRVSNGGNMNPSSEPGKVKWYWSLSANAVFIVRFKPRGWVQAERFQIGSWLVSRFLWWVLLANAMEILSLMWQNRPSSSQYGHRLSVHPCAGGQSVVRKTRAHGRGLCWRGRIGAHNSTTLCINRLLRGSLRFSENLGNPDLRVQPGEMSSGRTAKLRNRKQPQPRIAPL